MSDGTLRIVDVNGWRVVAPEGPMSAYPSTEGRYRRVRIVTGPFRYVWQGVAWQASQYLPVGEYEFTWIEEG